MGAIQRKRGRGVVERVGSRQPGRHGVAGFARFACKLSLVRIVIGVTSNAGWVIHGQVNAAPYRVIQVIIPNLRMALAAKDGQVRPLKGVVCFLGVAEDVK
jgi:hypothetical protein